jgi:CYTH domain-containing protein
MYDIIFITLQKNSKQWNDLKSKFPLAKKADSFEHARKISLTDFFWLVPDDVIVNSEFDFTYVPDQWSQNYVHVFKNNNSYDGIALIPKNSYVSNKEIEHRFYINKKEIDIVASVPKPYDLFAINGYQDYKFALENSTTELFWMSSNVITHDLHLVNTFYISHHDSQLRNQTHAFINQVDDQRLYNGLFLCTKRRELSEREVEYRFPVNRIEHNIVGSTKKFYDIVECNTYDEYLAAIESKDTTELFWTFTSNVKLDPNFKMDLYFTHDNEYDRKSNHNFIHRVDGKDYRNGVFLLTKHRPLTQREFEHRFIVNAKEWDVVASGPLTYPVFDIDSYDEYLYALENSKTEMFWMSSKNITANIPNIYFTHDNAFDRKTNHNFLHCGDKRNGLFLCSKHRPLTQREVEHRFLVNAKEWNIEASTGVDYSVYEIDSYDEYLKAVEDSKTEMFWMSSRNISATIPNVYFTHDNKYDRMQNHAFIHKVQDKDLYNGLFLCSKHRPLTQKEVEFRHIVNRKEWKIVGSGPKQYDTFVVDSYEDYLNAYDNTTTELFWANSNNISIAENFKFDIYFTHDNIYDRQQNHAFIHRVKGKDLYNGLFLLSKHRLLTKKEVEHRFILNRKEWNIVASGPCRYEIFYPKTYEDYIDALNASKTEMFWIVPDYVNPTSRFGFDTYFSHDEQYDRTITHAYLNGKYHDGILLCSKYAKFSKREFDYKFVAAKKEINIVISTPKPYDIVFISYQEPNADKNYNRILERFPNTKRVHGVKGIHQAHIEAAKLCDTDLFWIVDGDAIIVDDFKFDYQVARWDRETVHVWRSQNPINDMVYGYGGVKLFPTELTINMDISKPDMTTSISSKFKAVHDISNITAFNTDPFNTWKSAFRECTKLASKVIDRQKDEETAERLRIWCTVGAGRQCGKYAIQGAKMGSAYGLQNQGNIELLKKINDFDWLMKQFDEKYHKLYAEHLYKTWKTK